MSEVPFRQRLSAILAADAVGYSRLMGADEHTTVAALDAARSTFRTHIEANHGRVVDTAGDSVLAVFETASGAVSAALAIQQDLESDSEYVNEDRRLRFRIGVHLGDVTEKADGTVYGDGVNIAARLQGLAAAGGITVSDSVRSAVRGRVSVNFVQQGEQRIKNIAEPARAFRVVMEGGSKSVRGRTPQKLQQDIRFCTASDGVQLAYSVMGNGPPLVKAGNWMTHLEYELESPTRLHFWSQLARDRTVVRYDARGNGLSDREVADISLDAFVSDLEAVVEATRVGPFALMGYSQGCAVCIAYAVRHPDRVSHLILYGGFAQGVNKRAQTEQQKQAYIAMLTLMRLGWGQDNAAFRQVFTSQFMPDATKEQEDWFNELQRRASSPENAVRYMEAVANFDVIDLLPRVTVPTLVLHARDDVRAPFDSGRRIAAAIPGARLVPLQSRNHILEVDEAAATRFREEVQLFLSQDSSTMDNQIIRRPH
jgi:class 3 adenylate cyclase/pimeloyl-ACP methyl ester carboxylesterase